MPENLPEGITAEDIISAIRLIEQGVPNNFAESTGYDVLFENKRFAPKAVVGVAAAQVNGENLGPSDFKGGIGSKCFKILEGNGFEVITKGEMSPFPDEIPVDTIFEGGLNVVKVNRFERSPSARKTCIEFYGPICQVCDFDFEAKYGVIGKGFIHVHHIVPIAEVGREYEVDPIQDLRVVCPNCHAMLHKRNPPFEIEELRLKLR